MSWKKTAQSILLSLLVTFGLPTVAFAVCATGQQSCSSSYAVGEAFFGSGGNLSSCGSTYCSKQTAGETAVGNTKGTTYQAQAGFNTNRTPYIEMYVNTSSVDLGVLHSGTTATATNTFYVKTYLASGYVVKNASPPPKNGAYTMNALTTPTASNSSAEQFGINLTDNTGCTPAIAGSKAPQQIPSSTFSFGAAAHNSGSDYYDTSCQYMYVNGDTIARSTQSSGETDYTMSYIFNISNTTPGGTYTMQHVIVATSTF